MLLDLDIKGFKNAIKQLKEYTDKDDKEGLFVIEKAESVLSMYVIYTESKDKMTRERKNKLIIDLRYCLNELTTRIDKYMIDHSGDKQTQIVSEINKNIKIKVFGKNIKTIVKSVGLINDDFAMITLGIYIDSIKQPNKNVKDETAKRVVKELKEVSFMVIGEGYQELMKIIKKHNL